MHSYEGYDTPIARLRTHVSGVAREGRQLLARQGHMIEIVAIDVLTARRERLAPDAQIRRVTRRRQLRPRDQVAGRGQDGRAELDPRGPSETRTCSFGCRWHSRGRARGLRVRLPRATRSADCAT